MRLSFVSALFISAVIASPVFRRDMDGAKSAFNTIAGSANDAALVANTNTFFTNLNGSAPTDEINRAVKQVSDQISANNRDNVPTKQTAAWVSSVLAHFVADTPHGLVPAELNKRIYGGYELPECQAPFEVSVATIRGDVASTCGGTLISPTHVVTAAHCLVPYDKPYPVKVGYNSQIKTEQTVVRATKVTIHPSYLANPDDGRYDIAILEIPQIKFNKYTQRIPIYNSKISVGQKLLAVGWG
ncbi:hypothetical protein GGF43_003317, partial [Coemansia sp. RSA 2618]